MRENTEKTSPVKDFHGDQLSGPTDRDEAEVDVARLGRIVLMTIGRMHLLPVRDSVERVIGADQPDVGEGVDDSRVPLAGRLPGAEIGPAVQVAAQMPRAVKATGPETVAPTTARPPFARRLSFAT